MIMRIINICQYIAHNPRHGGAIRVFHINKELGKHKDTRVIQFSFTPLIFRNKTLSGCSVELVINLIVGFIILRNIYIILAMAFTATIVETFVHELDDNLFVPLFAGFVGQLLYFLI